MRKIAAIGLTAILIAGPVSPAEATALKSDTIRKEVLGPFVPDELTLERLALKRNTDSVSSAIGKLEKYVGKTWYVFSGSSPSGWDCSGLTMWFYEKLGIELEHRASKQGTSGTKTVTPKPGDLVVFRYNDSKSAYHVGIYIGDGKMIHSPRRGEVTRIQNVESFGGDYSKIEYRNFIETL